MSRLTYTLFVPAVLAPLSVSATVYLNVEQAQQAIFPGVALQRLNVLLTEDQRRAIEKRSGVRVRNAEVKAWKAADGSFFIIDEVLGKHEFITYAVGITARGAVRDIEIMEYRESYGYEIRNADWRAHFVGKTSSAPLQLDEDIPNISGATLSCRHITDGVKRVLATYELALK